MKDGVQIAHDSAGAYAVYKDGKRVSPHFSTPEAAEAHPQWKGWEHRRKDTYRNLDHRAILDITGHRGCWSVTVTVEIDGTATQINLSAGAYEKIARAREGVAEFIDGGEAALMEAVEAWTRRRDERRAHQRLDGAASDLLAAARLAVEVLDVKCPRCGEDAARVSTILRTAIWDAVEAKNG